MSGDNKDTVGLPGSDPSEIRPVSIADEMRRSYLDYAMSVIVSRALPDARDGLKPVHRRILFSMYENGFTYDKAYRKSARIVGDVIGKYHPHGDQSIYDALARMAQDFAMRAPLVDGQGNFGSIDGDRPAAMRYTEVRLARIAGEIVDDLDMDTVDFQPNYDGTEREPVVMPSRIPNLLLNGAGGIAVGMATNIPPHNLGELVDAVVGLIVKPEMTIEELNEIVLGPDFPTGGTILGRGGIRVAYNTGRGSVIMRARVEVETRAKDREQLVVSEIPYQVNKSTLIEKIAELVRDKRIEGISNVADESNREGIRIVIELKRDAVADVVLNQLYRYTPLQSSFGVNMVALNGGRPEVMNLKDLLEAFLSSREVVITRRTKFLLAKARARAHVLVGLAIAVANIDEVIAAIRTAPDPATAKVRLMSRAWDAREITTIIGLIDDLRHRLADDGTIHLSEEQAKAILDLRLQRLTALGREEIQAELEKIAAEIREFLAILTSRARVQEIIRDELLAAKAAFATPRQTEILEAEGDFEDEDLIQREEMVVTVSHAGYVKRVPLSAYRAQRRGGKGRAGMATREEDFVTRLFVASTHTPVLFFSSRGIVHKMKVWRLPIAAPQSRGKALVNMLPLAAGERITTVMPLPEDEAEWARFHVVFATTDGDIRRNDLADFVQINRNGKIAMKLEGDTSIVDVQLCTEDDDILLTTKLGQSIRFAVPEVRVFQSRNSTGVRGILLAEGDAVISMAIVRHVEASAEERSSYLRMRRAVTAGEEGQPGEPEGEEINADVQLSQERYAGLSAGEQFVLTVSERGFGKRSSAYEYRVTGRGGKGIVAMITNARNGGVVAAFPVEPSDQIMLVTDGGQMIRVPVDDIRIAGRNTQGVTIFDTADGEKVVSVERISDQGEDISDDAAPLVDGDEG
ncbi:DNA gyrase subunit A [Candidatus Raskinella chloraquaticus]|uniref:DNA gyrase subunit A n=1 Tax=Candidatus Raskinella chloraquaticus TaxID=1951219 RepID=UPI0026A5ABF4